MKIKVLLFAAAKDVFKDSVVEVDVRDDATVADVKAALVLAEPAAEDLLKRCGVSVQQTYASDETPVNSATEIAIIPPVSGG